MSVRNKGQLTVSVLLPKRLAGPPECGAQRDERKSHIWLEDILSLSSVDFVHCVLTNDLSQPLDTPDFSSSVRHEGQTPSKCKNALALRLRPLHLRYSLIQPPHAPLHPPKPHQLISCLQRAACSSTQSPSYPKIVSLRASAGAKRS